MITKFHLLRQEHMLSAGQAKMAQKLQEFQR